MRKSCTAAAASVCYWAKFMMLGVAVFFTMSALYSSFGMPNAVKVDFLSIYSFTNKTHFFGDVDHAAVGAGL